jgi:(p)ppGpp synthase/HD superfamily hydrolase
MHDVIEDVKNGEEKLYNKYDLELIELVKSVSEEDKSLSWHERKEAYINHLSEVGTKSLIISLSDRIYNLRDMILSLKENGLSVFEKFSV